MKIALHTPVVSPHQVPFARELARQVGVANFRYIYTQALTEARKKLGWTADTEAGLVFCDAKTPDAQDWLANADVLITSFRDCELIAARCAKGVQTYYCNERWFRPLACCAGLLPQGLAARLGRLRMLVPGYRRRARRLVDLCRRYPNFRMLPIGVHAFNDYAWAGVPQEKMTVWGYFVAPSAEPEPGRTRPPGGPPRPANPTDVNPLKVLWVGRPLPLKRVKDIEKACARLRQAGVAVTLTIKTGLPLDEVRAQMRTHDLYVFASNAYEGWGAVVSEALEEGMNVVGTFEAGASATLLPADHLYHAGDVKALTDLLRRAAQGKLELPEPVRANFRENWTAAGAVRRFAALVEATRHAAASAGGGPKT